mmetsp:Transcript_40555/g.59295  ORF Transcript_40555/g.59295 Transcript_40555/m.59295 type:complete len:683 (-) Transcript_40555:343-2391(-)
MGRSGGAQWWFQTKFLSISVLTAALASLVLWYTFCSAPTSKLIGYDKDDEDEVEEVTKPTKKLFDDDGPSSTTKPTSDIATPIVSNVKPPPGTEPPPLPTGKLGKTPTIAAPPTTKSTANDEEVKKEALHTQIETIDKRGKALFKAKNFMDAASAFTEALDAIDAYLAESKSTTAAASLNRQIITLTNNRSAMYEKASMPDLALHDCDDILSRDVTHSKARLRRLRILEARNDYTEALVEVCALQLRFMQENRDKLRMGQQVPNPPVPQSKIEELMGKLIPDEVEKQLNIMKNQNKEDRKLPSSYTIKQLLKSFTGYNAWMANAARGGPLDKFTSELNELGNDIPNDDLERLAKRTTLLSRRGRRNVYEQKFEDAKNDFEAAYKCLNINYDAIKDLLEDDEHARLLEWVGMVRHLRYDLDGALTCYERCCDLEPINAELLVKRAGVKMDGGNHEEAMTLFETALGLDPDAVDALLHRANLRMLQMKPIEAKADLERCLELRPNHILARLRLAAVLMGTEDLDGAKACLDKAEAIDDASSEVHSYRGEMYFAQGELKEAREEFDRAIECDATNPTPYLNSALAIMNTPPMLGTMPDINGAIELLEKAIEADPQFQAAYVNLGQLKLSMATDLTSAKKVISLYDQGLEYCRTAEELKDICSMRLLTIAQVDAASALKMESLNMQ